MMNHTDGWMSGWMGGGMWNWTVIGLLVVVATIRRMVSGLLAGCSYEFINRRTVVLQPGNCCPAPTAIPVSRTRSVR